MLDNVPLEPVLGYEFLNHHDCTISYASAFPVYCGSPNWPACISHFAAYGRARSIRRQTIGRIPIVPSGLAALVLPGDLRQPSPPPPRWRCRISPSHAHLAHACRGMNHRAQSPFPNLFPERIPAIYQGRPYAIRLRASGRPPDTVVPVQLYSLFPRLTTLDHPTPSTSTPVFHPHPITPAHSHSSQLKSRLSLSTQPLYCYAVSPRR